VGQCRRRCSESPLLISLESSDSTDSYDEDVSTSSGETTEPVKYTIRNRPKTKTAVKKIREKGLDEGQNDKVAVPEKGNMTPTPKSDNAGMAQLIRQMGLLTTSIQSLSVQNRAILAKQDSHSAKFLAIDIGSERRDSPSASAYTP
jgi:hypothetical protein